ncbi:MAG: hypothetical protein HEQ27_12540 [Dolichospermum sp. JUN01]|nr:hypothetical protein [Dolichospermum sp. JUN01]MBS9394536.1 hypothetical protein [Dolichospermum sp. OL01]MCO5798165.1 hypothetical protein [Dolichospermum sp. OL03]MCS6280282.1 hypothetical protein [Dolichospermum sp.]
MKILTPDRKTVISGSSDHTIKIWNLAIGRKKLTLLSKSGIWEQVQKSPPLKVIVTG